jgi:hypothetical protein
VRARLATTLTVLLAGAAVALPAPVSAAPVYRDPPSYGGIKKPPKTKAPPLPPSVSLAPSGTFPDVLLDEAGTAHVVWNDGRGDDSDATVYCRLKRGATACDGGAKVLTWDKGYGEGDGPQFNTDNDGPRIVRVGDQLVILSKRYPTIADKPDGASSSTTIEWVSSDGGTIWDGPGIVGKYNLGQQVVVPGDDTPSILNLAYDPLCNADPVGSSEMCLEAYRSGEYASGAGNLATGTDQNYNATLALDHQTPIAAFEDLAFNTYLRRYKGSGAYDDPANWSQPTTLKADEPWLAGGPAGAYLLSRPAAGGPFDIRGLAAGGDGKVVTGAATRITGKDEDEVFGRLAQDSAGHLLAAWERRGGSATGVYLRSGSGGAATSAGNGRVHAAAAPTLGTAQRLITGADNGQINLAAAPDGGGFTVLNHTGGVNSPGQIVAAGFGTQAPTGNLGLGAIRGGEGNVACQKVKFGTFTIDSSGPCFLHGTGAKAREVVTSAEVNLNGLRIVPDVGSKLVIDPKTLSLNTIGSVRVIVSSPVTGDVVLFHGEIKRDLSAVLPGTSLFKFPSQLFKANVLGFGVSADIDVKLEKDGVHIPVDLKLPPAFGGFTGHADLRADKQAGLHLDSLHIHLGPIPLGALTINAIDLDYTGAGDIWDGKGAITVPAGGRLDAEAEFDMGDFKRATLGFTPTKPVPIGPFVYLLRIGGGFEVDPIHINANAKVGAGAAVDGKSPVDVNGDFDMIFPKSGPWTFKMSGTASVLTFGLANAFLRFQTDGYADFGGHTGLSLGPLSVNADANGFVDGTTGDFGAQLKGTVSLCLKISGFKLCGDAQADTALSNRGFAACAGFNPPDPIGHVSGGIEFPWKDFSAADIFSPIALTANIIRHISIPCSTAGYAVAPPRAKLHAAQAGASAVGVPGGLPTATLLVEGDGGAPDVTVTGPGGVNVSEAAPSAAGFVTTVDGVDAAYVVLNKPAAGDYTVTPNDGSAAVKSVMVGQGYRQATVKAKLGGRGRKRSIAYTIANLGSGQSVEFAESGSFGTRMLGTATKAKGTLKIKPAAVRGGKRTVIAIVQHDGVEKARSRVGTYTAPAPPGPGRVRGLRAKRKGNTLQVSWRRVAGAKRYAVRLRGGRGTQLATLTARKRATFAHVRRDEKLRVSVQAIGPAMRTGKARTLTVRAAKR